MTVRELLEKIIKEAPNRLDSEIYFSAPKDDYSVKCYVLDINKEKEKVSLTLINPNN